MSCTNSELTFNQFLFYKFTQVDPIPEENPEFSDKILAPQIKKYYEYNEVRRFQYSRPFVRGQRDRNEAWTEFATLWVKRTIITSREPFPDVLQWFPILDDPEVFELTPLDNAIETIEGTNKDIENLIQEYTRKNANPAINPLTQKLKGIIGKKN